jgi:hypothetical protein
VSKKKKQLDSINIILLSEKKVIIESQLNNLAVSNQKGKNLIINKSVKTKIKKKIRDKKNNSS